MGGFSNYTNPPNVCIPVLCRIAIGAGTATVFVVFHPQSHSITAQSLKESIFEVSGTSMKPLMLEVIMCHTTSKHAIYQYILKLGMNFAHQHLQG